MLTVRSTINIASQTVPSIIPVVQGDTGRAILFTLADFTIPAGASATYYVQKPSGEAVYNNATIDGNTVLVELTAQSIIEKGDNYGQVRITVGEDVVTSFDFILLVKEFRGIDAVESLTEMNIFDKAVEQAAEEIDDVKTGALDDIGDAKDAALQEIEQSTGNFADAFSASTTYAAGDYVIHSGQLYRFTANHAAGAWTGSDAEAVTVGEELTDLKADTSTLKEDLDILNDAVGVNRISGSADTQRYKYTIILPSFPLSEGITYKATFSISEAISNSVYCYIIDNTDPEDKNLYPGGTTLVSGTTSYTVQFTPAKDYADVRASVYTSDVLTASVVIETIPANKIAALEERTANIKPFEFGHNGIKTSVFMGYNLWSQGCARVRDTLVGFNASNDDHSNTAIYTSMYYANGYKYNARGNHNLGHCASADYRSDTDVMLVANGTYAEGVVPTVYLISNAYATTDSGNDILITDSNVMALEFTTLDGAGCLACFGETSDIIYVMTADDPAHPFVNGNRYIYKMLLGKGSVNMVTLHPSDSVGTFVSGKSDTEFNGTAYIMNRYVAQYPVELQGLKYLNGRLLLSMDAQVDSISTGYLAYIKMYDSDQSFVIEDALWIPSLDTDGNYVNSEPEGFAIADGIGYIVIFRNSMSENRTKTLAFYLNE